MAKKVIITGSSGMIGKGVLLECLESPQIERVLVINRKSIGLKHPKLVEALLPDFLDVATLKDKLIGYDAVFYCMGISSLGLNEEQYTKITFAPIKAFADVLHQLNPDMTFIYVSGQSTDSTEKGSTMWARVKGRTENYVLSKGFKDAYAYRPGAIIPEKGVKSRTSWYQAMYVITRPLFPLFKLSNNVTTTSRIGQSMIKLLSSPLSKKIVDPPDINALANG